MSWDIHIQDLPKVARVEDIPDDFQPQPLGPRDEVIARISSTLPNTDFSDPSWGIIDGDGWSIEFNVGREDPCESVMLHVRGGGTDAVFAVQRAINAIGGRGLDMQTGEFFSADASRESLEKWQDYRDTVVQQYERSEELPKPKGLFSRLFGLR